MALTGKNGSGRPPRPERPAFAPDGALRYRCDLWPDMACLANTAGEARAWFKATLGLRRLPPGARLVAERP